jgi:Subtilase family/von Willebrand factor type A domain
MESPNTMHVHSEPRAKWPKGLIAAIAVALMLVACGGGSGSSATPPPTIGTSEGFAQPAATTTVQVDGHGYVVAAKQVFVALAEDVTAAQYDAVIDRLKTLQVSGIGQRLDMRLLLVTVPNAGGEAAVIAAMSAQPGVTYSGYNHVVQVSRANPPRAARSDVRFALASSAPTDATADARYWVNQIELPAAHAVETELGVSEGPRIAVVDTGLPASQTIIDEARVARVDALGASLSGDDTSASQSHGLWTSAFAAGKSPSAEGVSRYASVLMVDVYKEECTGILSFLGCPIGIGRTFQSNLAEGIRTAVQSPARVINVSFGDLSECADAEAERLAARQGFRAIHTSAVNLARRSDKLLVFSAGNNCEKADDQLLPSVDDAAADSWRSNALVVGASTSAMKDALFSRMGSVVNLMAPGEDVSYGASTLSGTSFSAPIVAGTAAVVQGVNPSLSAPETRFLLLNGAEATVTFADAKAARYKGYEGSNATGPNLLLNAGNSAKAAKLTRDSSYRALPAVALAKGERKTVTFDVELPSTGVRALDVVFLVDVSGSYGDDIASLKRQASAIVDSLAARGIDVHFGVSEFADFPLASYGANGDNAYRRLARITNDKPSVLSAINALTIRDGGDEPEAQLEALYQVATGSGRDINGDRNYDGSAGDVAPQPMGFRTGAAKVVLLATDARFHDRDVESGYPGSGFGSTVDALKAQGVRVIALQSGSTSSATADIARLVTATGGAAFQLSSDSAQIAAAIAAGIDATLAEVVVTAETIAGAEWIVDLTQDKPKAAPGGKVTFIATLQGQRAESVDRLAYDLYIWVRGNGSALIQRVKIPVEVSP